MIRRNWKAKQTYTHGNTGKKDTDQASNTKNKATSHCPCNICLPLIAYSAFETIHQLKERGEGGGSSFH